MILKSLAFNLRRPSLNWLSRKDVNEVRNRILSLYLAPGEHVVCAPPPGTFGARRIALSYGGWPQFNFEYASIELRVTVTARLKFHLESLQPYWDCSFDYINRKGSPEKGYDEIIPFNAKGPLEIPAAIVKAFARYFPFVPTENYLQQGGKFIV